MTTWGAVIQTEEIAKVKGPVVRLEGARHVGGKERSLAWLERAR